MKRALFPAAVLAGLALASQAHAVAIDGDLADWGLKQNGNSADWIPNSGVLYSIEDQHSSYLNPGYGGQAYDVEAMYLAQDQNTLYIAIATGHSPLTPDNPAANQYAAGDIAIDLGADGTWDLGIETMASGTQGSIYANVNWAYGIWNAAGGHDPAHPDLSHPTSILSGTLQGSATLAYTTLAKTGYGAWVTDPHYFYEVAVPLSIFGGQWAGSPINVHWTMNCNNDNISVRAGLPNDASRLEIQRVPEPATLALLPLGLLGLLVMRRRPEGSAQ